MQTDTKDQVYAGFFVRLVAFLVDMFIVNAALIVIRLPMWIISLRNSGNVLTRDFLFQYSIADIVCYLLTLVYFVLLTYYTGSTLGKKLFQLRVVSTEDRKLTLFEVIYRESIGRFLSTIILHLGYLLVLVQKEHRGVHDLLSDSCVIYYHEKKIYVHAQMNYRNMAPQPGYTVPPQPGYTMPGEGGTFQPGTVPGGGASFQPGDNMPGGGEAYQPGAVPGGEASLRSGDTISGDGTSFQSRQAGPEQEVSSSQPEDAMPEDR